MNAAGTPKQWYVYVSAQERYLANHNNNAIVAQEIGDMKSHITLGLDTLARISEKQMRRTDEALRTSAPLLVGSFWEPRQWGPKEVQCPVNLLAAVAGKR